MDETNNRRQQGVELGDLSDELEAESYPVTSDEVVERYGDRQIVMADETVELREILDPIDETFQDNDDVRTAILNMVGDEAIGRKGYSDRTPPAPGEEEERDSESF